MADGASLVAGGSGAIGSTCWADAVASGSAAVIAINPTDTKVRTLNFFSAQISLWANWSQPPRTGWRPSGIHRMNHSDQSYAGRQQILKLLRIDGKSSGEGEMFCHRALVLTEI